MNTLCGLLEGERPRPGSGPRSGRGGVPLVEQAVVVAICLLREGEGEAMSMRDLLGSTDVLEHYRGLNSFGDATGLKFLALDRDTKNLIERSEENLRRAAFWVQDHPLCTEGVNRLLPEFAVGSDLLVELGLN